LFFTLTPLFLAKKQAGSFSHGFRLCAPIQWLDRWFGGGDDTPALPNIVILEGAKATDRIHVLDAIASLQHDIIAYLIVF